MRATMVVTASEGSGGLCKVVLKIWDVPNAELRKLMTTCDHIEGVLTKRSLLEGAVDVVCNMQEHSVTLVKPAVDRHGLQSRFEELLGKSLAYRLSPLQATARQLANDGDRTPQEDRLEGYPVSTLFEQLREAAQAAATPSESSDRKVRRRKVRSRQRLATT